MVHAWLGAFYSALVDSGRKVEALKYLRLVVAYNPDYNYLLEEVENEEDDFASNLASSRRRDYWFFCIIVSLFEL